MTCHAYQRMLRINTMVISIKEGEIIAKSAFDSDDDSLSGFNESDRSIFGGSDIHTNEKNTINVVYINTPIGSMFACATKKGLCLLDFTDRKMLETEFNDLCKRLNAVILPGSNPYLRSEERRVGKEC